MNLDLKGRGLFVFSDPGGAKPLLSYISKNISSFTFVKVLSDRKYDFFNAFNVKVDEPLNSIEMEFQLNNPDFLFIGTSYTSNIELVFLKEAKKRGIVSYAFIDHWTSLRERFILEGTEIYPDFILVIDERAKNKAIEASIPSYLIHIFGNPYYDFLLSWKPVVSRDTFFKDLNLDYNNKFIITYAPDPLSNVNGESEFGFDEISTSYKLCNAIKDLDDSFLFLLKAHPNQNVEKIKNVLSEKIILLPNNVDVNSLIFYSNLIIGFFSNFLIEAKIMQKPVFRLLIDGYKKDPFESMNVGKVVNIETIVNDIKSLHHG